MTQREMCALALKAIEKKWDFEQLKYGDDLYGHEHDADAVWDLVSECEVIGTEAFRNKYEQKETT